MEFKIKKEELDAITNFITRDLGQIASDLSSGNVFKEEEATNRLYREINKMRYILMDVNSSGRVIK